MRFDPPFPASPRAVRAQKPDSVAAAFARNAAARALWIEGAGRAALRETTLPRPAHSEVQVRTLYSAVSRGTERLVFEGRVPSSEHARMACPMQEGRFTFPVKYGYCAVGEVEDGPPALLGRTVFALHPHQDRFVVPLTAVTPVPDAVPARRATLAANMETALNGLWDGGASPADRIVVVGAGTIGLLCAHLAARMSGAEVTVVDIAAARAPLAEALGLRFRHPDEAPRDADLVIHASACGSGLVTAIACAGEEATIVEMSWYGTDKVEVALGGAFHARRLRLVSSQVGAVPAARRARWSPARRLAAALDLLDDPRLDVLVSDEIAFADLPAALPAILTGQDQPPVIRYP